MRSILSKPVTYLLWPILFLIAVAQIILPPFVFFLFVYESFDGHIVDYIGGYTNGEEWESILDN